jgi:hypothetical protein
MGHKGLVNGCEYGIIEGDEFEGFARPNGRQAMKSFFRLSRV